MGAIKDYFKSVIVNKYILASYLSLGISIPILQSDLDHWTVSLAGAFIGGLGILGLLETSFGKTTFKAYRKTKKQILEEQKITPENLPSVINTKYSTYCAEQGYLLAMKEAGLEKLIKN